MSGFLLGTNIPSEMLRPFSELSRRVMAGNPRRRGYRARDITARRMLLMRVE
jgi:hypothetical protein